jgi:hypothetical protein
MGCARVWRLAATIVALTVAPWKILVCVPAPLGPHVQSPTAGHLVEPPSRPRTLPESAHAHLLCRLIARCVEP